MSNIQGVQVGPHLHTLRGTTNDSSFPCEALPQMLRHSPPDQCWSRETLGGWAEGCQSLTERHRAIAFLSYRTPLTTFN